MNYFKRGFVFVIIFSFCSLPSAGAETSKDAVEKIETFNEMRKELATLGLEKLMPEAITGLTQEDNDKN